MNLTNEKLIEYGFIKSGTKTNTEWFKMCNDGVNKVSISENKELFSNNHLSYFFQCGGLGTNSSIDIKIKTCEQLENLYYGLTQCKLI